MQNLNNVFIKNYDGILDKWLLINVNEYFIINNETKRLVEILKNSPNIESSIYTFNKDFGVSLNKEDFKLFTESTLNKIGISLFTENIKNDDKPFIKHKITLINTKYCYILSKWTHILIYKKHFPVFFSLILLINLLFIYFEKSVTNIIHKEISNIIMLLFVLLPAVIFHELGHIGACEKFGAKNGGIGVGLLLVFPVFFADVTQTWSLNKNERIITSLSGVYIQSFYTILLFTLFHFTKVGFLFDAAFLLFINGLYQLFPFVRSDGYWVLSDITGYYNLKSKSNIVNIIRSYFEGV